MSTIKDLLKELDLKTLEKNGIIASNTSRDINICEKYERLTKGLQKRDEKRFKILCLIARENNIAPRTVRYIVKKYDKSV